jgi:hypothetical protein
MTTTNEAVLARVAEGFRTRDIDPGFSLENATDGKVTRKDTYLKQVIAPKT